MINDLINKMLYSPNRKNFLTTNYSNKDKIKESITKRFPELKHIVDEDGCLDSRALYYVDRQYDITLDYKIQDADIIDKIIEHCINMKYDYKMFVIAIALLEDILINGTKDMYAHHILTMEFVIKSYIDNFIEEYTEHIHFAEDEEENLLIKFHCIVKVLNDEVLYNMLISQASGSILIGWLSDFNDLLLYHYKDDSLEEIRENCKGYVSYISADLKIFASKTYNREMAV